VDGHNAYSIGVGILVILPTLWVRVFSVEFKKVGKCLIFLSGLRVIVNGLIIGDELAELAQIVEDDFPVAVRDPFFTDAGFFEERLEGALDRVETKAFSRVVE
jgi:hypothetical protein